jgi:hypothetical protein
MYTCCFGHALQGSALDFDDLQRARIEEATGVMLVSTAS